MTDRNADDRPASESPSVEPDAIAGEPPEPADRPALAPVLDDLGTRLREADGLLFLLDFDGTLAPIVEDPSAAAPLDGVPEIVRTLRDADRVAVGLVSGRALADLRERVGVPGVHYAGNHGLELQAPEGSDGDGGAGADDDDAGGDPDDADVEVHPDAAAAADAIGAVADDVAARIEGIDGARVEDKRVTATVHYRAADDEDVPDVKNAVENAVDDADPDLRVTSGKAILEIRPDVDWDKGAAVDWLRDRLVPDDERWVDVYVGDDVTDEDAFEALSETGAGIAVGSGETVADHRIRDPDAARALTRWVAGPGRRQLALDAGEAD